MPSTPVVLLHDAAVDEYMVTVLLTLMPGIDLRGIIVVNADCIAEPAMDAASRLQQFLGREDIPLALSRARGWNAFPWSYRTDCVSFGQIPSLQPYKSKVGTPPPSGEALLMQLLEQAIAAGAPLTVLVTSPMTPLTDVLKADFKLIEGIDKVVWMGGAINVPGNLDPTTVPPAVANKHAEWNAFWDPYAVDFAFRWFQGINVFPLDITNNTPLTKEFMSALQQQGRQYSFSQLAFEAYSLVAAEPFYDMWDVTTACWLSNPGLYAPPTLMGLGIETWGFNQGWIKTPLSANPKLRNAQNVFLNFQNKPGFYSYVLSLLQKSNK
ncbi:MAG TPA: nucleoside hydrolase [Candidatus Limnocylindrales bacterium]|nr:nucleoside hydrolase [Candidatus Limnocylindrales bacterium]